MVKGEEMSRLQAELSRQHAELEALRVEEERRAEAFDIEAQLFRAQLMDIAAKADDPDVIDQLRTLSAAIPDPSPPPRPALEPPAMDSPLPAPFAHSRHAEAEGGGTTPLPRAPSVPGHLLLRSSLLPPTPTPQRPRPHLYGPSVTPAPVSPLTPDTAARLHGLTPAAAPRAPSATAAGHRYDVSPMTETPPPFGLGSAGPGQSQPQPQPEAHTYAAVSRPRGPQPAHQYQRPRGTPSPPRAPLSPQRLGQQPSPHPYSGTTPRPGLDRSFDGLATPTPGQLGLGESRLLSSGGGTTPCMSSHPASDMSPGAFASPVPADLFLGSPASGSSARRCGDRMAALFEASPTVAAHHVARGVLMAPGEDDDFPPDHATPGGPTATASATQGTPTHAALLSAGGEALLVTPHGHDHAVGDGGDVQERTRLESAGASLHLPGQPDQPVFPCTAAPEAAAPLDHDNVQGEPEAAAYEQAQQRWHHEGREEVDPEVSDDSGERPVERRVPLNHIIPATAPPRDLGPLPAPRSTATVVGSIVNRYERMVRAVPVADLPEPVGVTLTPRAAQAEEGETHHSATPSPRRRHDDLAVGSDEEEATGLNHTPPLGRSDDDEDEDEDGYGEDRTSSADDDAVPVWRLRAEQREAARLQRLAEGNFATMATRADPPCWYDGALDAARAVKGRPKVRPSPPRAPEETRLEALDDGRSPCLIAAKHSRHPDPSDGDDSDGACDDGEKAEPGEGQAASAADMAEEPLSVRPASLPDAPSPTPGHRYAAEPPPAGPAPASPASPTRPPEAVQFPSAETCVAALLGPQDAVAGHPQLVDATVDVSALSVEHSEGPLEGPLPAVGVPPPLPAAADHSPLWDAAALHTVLAPPGDDGLSDWYHAATAAAGGQVAAARAHYLQRAVDALLSAALEGHRELWREVEAATATAFRETREGIRRLALREAAAARKSLPTATGRRGSAPMGTGRLR